jgi:glutamine amidotransferase
MNVTLFDYGAGNLHSLAKALEGPGVTVRLETDPRRAVEASTDVLVLPGVGAFGAAIDRLAPGRDAMRAAILGGLPTIGICLGMQLLFDGSDEGAGEGLGVIPGQVTRLRAVRVPQIGWNDVEPVQGPGRGDPLFTAAPLAMVYYANSYVCRPVDERVVTAWTEHEGDRFPAAVRAGRAVGVQFHPEKSSSEGVRFLRTFLDLARQTESAR